MWPWNTQYSEFFVSNLFAQPPVIGTLLSNTNKIVEPKDIPNLQIPYTDLKLIDESHHNIVNTKDFKSDARLLEAVKQINPEFMIEEIVSVPGRHTHTAVKLEKKSKPVNLSQSSTTSPKLVSKSLNFTSKATLANSGFSNSKQKSRPTLSKQISESTELKTNDSIVKVEATGQTASSGIIPQIPFGSYFLSYLANDKRGVSKTAALILEPHSKAVVGNGGTAVSAPISKAFLKRGIPTNVYFNPESVAIAGVGGKAHAQADLELDLVQHAHNHNPSIPKEYSYPYYGGLRGQILQVVKTKDGEDNMFIISPTSIPTTSVKSISSKKNSVTTTVDNDQLNNKPPTSIAFEQDFNRIQIAAARLVAIQEVAKRKGSFSAEDNRIYAESLLELGHAAQNLANLHETGQIKDFSLLLQPDFQLADKKPLVPPESIAEIETSGGEQKVDEVTEQLFNEEDLLPPNTEDPYEDVSDTVAVTAPKKDASVAEAKPIGLSIAGEGGVASSKPNAIALSGRNGLAVSAPKATAIAGVSAEEAAAFSVAIPNRNNLVIKNVNHTPQRPVYDDYIEDYSDVLPPRSTFTRDTTVTHGSPIPVMSKKTKLASITETDSDAAFADSLVKQWKTIIAEDYSASARSAPKLTPTRYIKEVSKFPQRSIDKKAYF